MATLAIGNIHKLNASDIGNKINEIKIKKMAHPQLTYKEALSPTKSNWINFNARPAIAAFETKPEDTTDCSLNFRNGEFIATENYSVTTSSLNFGLYTWIKFDPAIDKTKTNYICISYEDASSIMVAIPNTYDLTVWNYLTIVGSASTITITLNDVQIYDAATSKVSIPASTFNFASKSYIYIGNSINDKNVGGNSASIDNLIAYSGPTVITMSTSKPSDYTTKFTNVGNTGTWEYTDIGNHVYALS